jgi:hypothetical protein
VTAIQTTDDASVAADADFLLIHSAFSGVEIWDGKRMVVRTERAPQVA